MGDNSQETGGHESGQTKRVRPVDHGLQAVSEELVMPLILAVGIDQDVHIEELHER